MNPYLSSSQTQVPVVQSLQPKKKDTLNLLEEKMRIALNSMA